MITNQLPDMFIANEIETGAPVFGDLIHCGKRTYIKRNDVEEVYDTRLDIWRNIIEVDPNSVIMSIDKI